MKNGVTVSVDFLTFTHRGLSGTQEDAEYMIRVFLGMDTDLFTPTFGLYGYASRYSFGNIEVLFDPCNEDMGVCLSLSGQGCATFSAHGGDMMALLSKIHIAESVYATRLDAACDDRKGYLAMEDICDAAEKKAGVRCRFRRSTVIRDWEGTEEVGTTVYLGSKKQDLRFRIYDKEEEMATKDPEHPTGHWIRVEMACRGTYANNAIAEILNANSIGQAVSAMLNGHLQFIERDDSNISRCSVSAWWADFVDSLAKVCIYTRGEVVHTIARKFGWLMDTVAPTLSMCVDVYGYDFPSVLYRHGQKRRTDQQDAVVRNAKSLDSPPVNTFANLYA